MSAVKQKLQIINTNFEIYSKYYDLLYQDKDYKNEVEYIHKLIQTEYLNAKKILEFGSGTGKHGLLLQKKGYKIYGLEKSPIMAQKANESGFHCKVADITYFKLDEKFDVVLALFHVMSYLNDNTGILNVFKNAADHLNANGLFMFDIWYLPAVIRQLPEKRIKRVADESIEILREAKPFIDFNKNIVNVSYKLTINNKPDNTTFDFEEIHSMRYFSLPEIELYASLSGFEVIRSEEFLSGEKPSEKTWGVFFILKKK